MKDIHFKLLTGFTILIGSLGFLPMGLSIRANQAFVFELIVMSFCAIAFIKNNWIKAFFVYCVFRLGFTPSANGVLTLHVLFFSLMFYQILVSKLTKERVAFIFNIIAIAAILQSLAIIGQYFGLWIFLHPKDADLTVLKPIAFDLFNNKTLPIRFFNPPIKGDYVGMLDNSNIAGAFLAMCAPALLRKWWWLGFALVIPAMILVKSLGAIIALSVAFMIFLFYKEKRNAFYMLIPLILLVGVYVYKCESITAVISGSSRFKTWETYCTKVIPKKPIFGWGIGKQNALYPIINDTFRKAIDDNKGKTPKEIVYDLAKNKTDIGQIFKHSHNEPLTVMVELGIIGFILFMGYFITISRGNILAFCGVISSLVCSLYIFNLHSSIGLLMIVYMAIAEYSNNDKQEVGL